MTPSFDESRGQERKYRGSLLEVAAQTDGLLHQIESLLAELPDPRFAPDTDEPLNLAAALLGAMQTVLEDELRPASASLRRAAEWTEDSASWRLRD